MTRAEVLRGLLHDGRGHDMPRMEALAVELGVPVADVLVVAGLAVPGRLLPPERDKAVMRAFTFRVTWCNHAQLAALGEFLAAMPAEGVAPEARPARDLTQPDPFPGILRGLMSNRGFGPREFP